MAKRSSTLINMVLTLFLVTFIASSVLGFIYELTKEPIRLALLLKKTNAIRIVLPEFTNVPSEDVIKVPIEKDTLYFYEAKRNDTLIGYAIETYTKKGFSGEIKLMVGILTNGTIYDVSVLEHKETPGLGDKMEKSKSDWSNQFRGKNPEDFILKVKKDGGDVDAITASTISSRAFCDAMQRAYDEFVKMNTKDDNTPSK